MQRSQMFVCGKRFCGAGELRQLTMEKYQTAKGIPEPKGCGGLWGIHRGMVFGAEG